MKYFDVVVLRGPQLPARALSPRRGMRSGRRFERELLVDMRRLHPFTGWMPGHTAEVVEEIGGRLTVLAVRTHVPLHGSPRPPVTLRMRHALRMLARRGGDLSVGGLATAIGVGMPAASQLSARMSRRGLVTKTKGRAGGSGRDARVCTVRLTPQGWRHVPRDEPRRDHASWSGADDGGIFGRGAFMGAWPEGLRRRSQPPTALESGLGCAVLDRRGLLAGLRAVHATMTGFSYGRWEGELEFAVVGRRRHRRDRNVERHVIAAIGRPEYRAPAPRWPRRRGRRPARQADARWTWEPWWLD